MTPSWSLSPIRPKTIRLEATEVVTTCARFL